MPRLLIFDDSVRGVDLPGEPLVIGRSRKSDIPIRDGLLSRKHCAIFPADAGFRIIDLKSSHGTFLNGERIDRRDLAFDDVIEIGSTVMVYLDTGVWNRGEGLARLRNPLKAQELIQRINLQTRQADDIPIQRAPVGKRGSGGKRTLLDLLPLLMEFENDEFVVGDELLDLLVDYATYKTLSLWARRQPGIKRLLTKSVEKALLSCRPGDWENFREQLREVLRSELPERLDEAAGADEDASTPEGTDESW